MRYTFTKVRTEHLSSATRASSLDTRLRVRPPFRVVLRG